MRRPWGLAGAIAALILPVAGCGGNDKGSSTGSSGEDPGPLVVSAAASLKKAFTEYGQHFGQARFSFAGSDELAAEIRQGVKPDVFASADTKLPDQLFVVRRVEKPIVFAGNRLVLAVPKSSGGAGVALSARNIRSLVGIERPGVKLAIGSASVPVGSYTRKLLAALPARASRRILANVRSVEPDVKGIVGKLTQRAVDAGFVYITDVKATKGALRAIELPKNLKPSVAYGVAVVKGAKHPAAARRFIAGLLGGQGRRDLLQAGFEPPPK